MASIGKHVKQTGKSRPQSGKGQATRPKQRQGQSTRPDPRPSASKILIKPIHERSTRAVDYFKKTRFLFTELPPEIRNQIYGYLLTSRYPISISPLELPEYLRVKSTKLVTRSIFLKPSPGVGRHGMSWGNWTTYGLEPVENEPLPCTRILRTNRQINLEASTVFYKTNTFLFSHSSCLLPFMLDQRLATVRMIQSLEIMMAWLSSSGSRVYLGFLCTEWADVLTELGNFKGLRLKQLKFYIKGGPDDVQVQWIQKKYGAGICKLEKLSVEVAPLSFEVDHFSEGEIAHAEDVVWNKLAPKLLAKGKKAAPVLVNCRSPPFRRTVEYGPKRIVEI